MHTLVIVGFVRERKIHAIKDIRALSAVVMSDGLGLKDAKAVIDHLEAGGTVKFEVRQAIKTVIAPWLDTSHLIFGEQQPPRYLDSFDTRYELEPIDISDTLDPYSELSQMREAEDRAESRFGNDPLDQDIPF